MFLLLSLFLLLLLLTREPKDREVLLSVELFGGRKGRQMAPNDHKTVREMLCTAIGACDWTVDQLTSLCRTLLL